MKKLILFAVTSLFGSAHASPVDFSTLGVFQFYAQVCEVGCPPQAEQSPIESIQYLPNDIELENWFDGRFNIDFQSNGVLRIVALRDLTFNGGAQFFLEGLPELPGNWNYVLWPVSHLPPQTGGGIGLGYYQLSLNLPGLSAGETITNVMYITPEPSTFTVLLVALASLYGVKRQCNQ